MLQLSLKKFNVPEKLNKLEALQVISSSYQQDWSKLHLP